MYVCICNGLTESKVREALESAPSRSAREVFRILGVSPQCGTCLEHANEVIATAMARTPATVRA